MNMVTLPSRWENWSITKKIGEGSFGTVYRAECSIGTEKTISAVKIVEVPSDEYELQSLMNEMLDEQTVKAYYKDLVDGYADEIRTMDALKGITNIVSIEDYCLEEKPDGIGWIIYIRMEYLQSFHEYSSEQKLTENDVIRLGMDICTALSYCEKLNIVHRDIKPDNIFLSPMGHFKLGDFGVARRLDRTVGSYSAKGTYTYMAPEVYKGEHYGARADIYSLGMVLYRLMNRNRDPFVDPFKQIIYYKDRENALKQRMEGEKLPDPADASKEFAKIIRKATAYQQEDRYESASEMRDDLERLQIGRRERELMEDGDRTVIVSTAAQDENKKKITLAQLKKTARTAGAGAGLAAMLTGAFFLGRSGSSGRSGGSGKQDVSQGVYQEETEDTGQPEEVLTIQEPSPDAPEGARMVGMRAASVPFIGEVDAVKVEEVFRIWADHTGIFCFEAARTMTDCPIQVEVWDEDKNIIIRFRSDEQTKETIRAMQGSYYDLHVSYIGQETGFLIDVYPQENES